MGLEDILGKELKGASQLEEYYRNLADKYDLDYIPGGGYLLVLANKDLSEDADDRKWNTPPWPGIKIHSPLSVEMYNVLMSNDFIQMLKNREIDGFKVFHYDNPLSKHKEVTIYMSPSSLPYYKELINIFEKNGIHINPQLDTYSNGEYEISRIYISPEKRVFIRYSPDFTGKMYINDIKNIRDSIMSNIDTKDINNYINQVKIIQDYMEDNYWSKIHDEVWRAAADISGPRIFATSRSWLSENESILDHLLHTPSDIYTFITLKEIRGTIVPNPNIIISYNNYNKQLEAYDVFNAKIVKYNLSNREDLIRISDHPKERLYEFLRYGTISQ